MVLIPSHSFSFLRYAPGLWFFKFISDLATELAWWLMPTRFSSQENVRKYGWHMNTVPEVQETCLLFKLLNILSLFHLSSLMMR